MQEKRAKNVAIEKQVNPPRNVDAYYEVGPTRVSLEVKCAVEVQPSQESLVLKTAGRVPNHMETFFELKGMIETPPSDKKLELAKNKDNTIKNFFVLAT